MMISFLSFSSSVFRGRRWCRSGGAAGVVADLLLLLVLAPWALSFLVLRRALFVRFPRPRRWPPRSCGRGSAASGFCGCWRCVSVSALPSVRSGAFVWAVRPAVVARRSGVVLWAWAFVSAPPVGGAEAAAAAAASTTKGKEETK